MLSGNVFCPWSFSTHSRLQFCAVSFLLGAPCLEVLSKSLGICDPRHVYLFKDVKYDEVSVKQGSDSKTSCTALLLAHVAPCQSHVSVRRARRRRSRSPSMRSSHKPSAGSGLNDRAMNDHSNFRSIVNSGNPGNPPFYFLCLNPVSLTGRMERIL